MDIFFSNFMKIFKHFDFFMNECVFKVNLCKIWTEKLCVHQFDFKFLAKFINIELSLSVDKYNRKF
jgi:hypothetical protein